MAGNVRLIARLDLKMDFLIKGIQMEGWRKVGNPTEFAARYYHEGIDELIYTDVVASLYGRNNLSDVVRRVATEVFIPITVGGGIRQLSDVKELLSCGADKISINTAATLEPSLITRIADTYGSQAVVLSIECKRLPQGGWEPMTDNGRNRTGLNAVAWAVDGAKLGAGEILLTSIDKDGTAQGMDLELVKAVTSAVDIPVIASGGVGNVRHVVEGVQVGQASAIAMGRALHYKQFSLSDARSALRASGTQVRIPEEA